MAKIKNPKTVKEILINQMEKVDSARINLGLFAVGGIFMLGLGCSVMDMKILRIVALAYMLLILLIGYLANRYSAYALFSRVGTAISTFIFTSFVTQWVVRRFILSSEADFFDENGVIDRWQVIKGIKETLVPGWIIGAVVAIAIIILGNVTGNKAGKKDTPELVNKAGGEEAYSQAVAEAFNEYHRH